MNENLDLTKILNGCPKSTEFYNTIFGNVSLSNIILDHEYPIIMSQGIITIPLTKEGKYILDYDGECTLFPSKDQRDWSKFERFWDKPKAEKFDVSTLQPFDKALVRMDKNDCWKAVHFSHEDDYVHKAVCDSFYFIQCIPYNDETKHLVGTNDDCSNYYKWWEE